MILINHGQCMNVGKFENSSIPGNEQGSLNYPSQRNQTMQMRGSFEGFPHNSALFGLVI